MGMEWLSGGGSCGNGRGKGVGRTPLRGKVFYQPAYFCRGGYLIRPAEELYKSAFSLAKRDSFSVWLRPAQRRPRPLFFLIFGLPGRGPKPLFLFREKKTAVLDSEKEKVDQWK